MLALTELAEGLKLTERQRKFCDAYLVSQNATRAAITAGYAAKSAHVAGAQAIRSPKIQAYLRAALEAGRQLAERRTKRAIASVADCLEHMTAIKNARLGDYLRDDGEVDVQKIKEAPAGLIKRIRVKSTTDENGQVYAQHEIETESSLSAMGGILGWRKHRDILESKRDEPSPAINVSILNALTPEQLAQAGRLYRLLVTGMQDWGPTSESIPALDGRHD